MFKFRDSQTITLVKDLIKYNFIPFKNANNKEFQIFADAALTCGGYIVNGKAFVQQHQPMQIMTAELLATLQAMAEASKQYPRNSHIVVNSDNMAVVGFLRSGTANFIKNTLFLYYICKFLLFFNSKYFVIS
jgi:hypothetical protein